MFACKSMIANSFLLTSSPVYSASRRSSSETLMANSIVGKDSRKIYLPEVALRF